MQKVLDQYVLKIAMFLKAPSTPLIIATGNEIIAKCDKLLFKEEGMDRLKLKSTVVLTLKNKQTAGSENGSEVSIVALWPLLINLRLTLTQIMKLNQPATLEG